MNLKRVLVSVTVIFFLGVLIFSGLLSGDEDEKQKYACPMHCKNAVYEVAGICPVCGMQLVKESVLKEQEKNRTKVAILLFDGVQIIDYAAPYEVFGQADFDVFTVAEKRGTIVTSMNMTVQPNYAIADAPKANILLVPGGNIEAAERSQQVIRWIRARASEAEYVLSVCNGAFLLARAGLLDGLTATTFHRLIPSLKEAAPKTKVVSDKRYVDNGKIITSAGLTSGMDASLYLVSKIKGKGEAQNLALHLEYNWQPDSNFARAALSDMKLPQWDLPPDSKWRYVSTQGDINSWHIEGIIETDKSTADVRTWIVSTLKQNRWIPAESASDIWTRTDPDGTWKLNVSVTPNQPKNYRLTARLQKESRNTAQR